MNQKQSKGIKKRILKALYGEGVLLKDRTMKKERRKIYLSAHFRKIYKAAKRNYKNALRQGKGGQVIS